MGNTQTLLPDLLWIISIRACQQALGKGKHTINTTFVTWADVTGCFEKVSCTGALKLPQSNPKLLYDLEFPALLLGQATYRYQRLRQTPLMHNGAEAS